MKKVCVLDSNELRADEKYRRILKCIGQFKDDFEVYKIHLIDYNDGEEILKIDIHLERPGMFIGRKGENLKKIQEKLKIEFKKESKISVIEYDPIPLITKETFYTY